MTPKRVFLLCFTLGFLVALLACAPAQRPATGPPTAVNVHYGINDGFHGPLPPDIVQHYYDYKGPLTIRTPHLTAASLMAFRISLRGSTIPASSPFSINVLALVEGTDAALAAAFARDWLVDDVWPVTAIENGNELELKPLELKPSQYADAQGHMAVAERNAGFTGDILFGGVYALTDGPDGTKVAILEAMDACADCLVTLHVYEPLTSAQVKWLNDLGRDIAITEAGSPTGCSTSRWQEQADYVAAIRASALQVRRLKYFIIYQRPSGPGCSNYDTFGLQGVLCWKPLDALLRTWAQR